MIKKKKFGNVREQMLRIALLLLLLWVDIQNFKPQLNLNTVARRLPKSIKKEALNMQNRRTCIHPHAIPSLFRSASCVLYVNC